ncbi:hypothetical protein PVK06_000172 [Gossypium arboreum]|uniref:Secreted protein n=1 Tax=Gossypium arboreum TaxID=29729 RepID=A0ABR0QYN5_GOSAR|nr:hypothetical protein PVK06_000172 [Gossypium arboreum]
MDWKRKAWAFAAIVAAVEASKVRKLCRSSKSSHHQNVFNNVGSTGLFTNREFAGCGRRSGGEFFEYAKERQLSIIRIT